MSGSSDSTPPPGSARPDAPWLPANVHVWGVYTRERRVWVRDRRTGDRVRRTRKRYDVRFRVDGFEFRCGFDQKGWADDFAIQLQRDFARGRLFDPNVRRFLPEAHAAASSPAEGPSFYDLAREYVAGQWRRWEPATRPLAQLVFARACIQLLRENSPALDSQDRRRADEFLRRVMLAGDQPAALKREDALWDEWFGKWSLPIRQITDRQLRDLLASIRDEAPDGRRRPAAPATVNRARGALRAAFTQARKQRLIDWDPWDAVPAEPMPDHEKVDPDLVMDPAEIRLLADECGRIKARYRAVVLLQGLCGLRPGEAMELRRRDLELVEGAAGVTVRGSRTSIPSRFLTEGELRRRPLKGRGPKATRTVPVPAQLAVVLREHLAAFVPSRADAVVFTNANGGRINPSNFRRDVWYPARAAVFDEASPLRRVRMHDLRHSAITTWLNAGVPLKTAQLWSGHRSLSVLLDTYVGVMKGDEEAARQRLEAAIDPNLVRGS